MKRLLPGFYLIKILLLNLKIKMKATGYRSKLHKAD